MSEAVFHPAARQVSAPEQPRREPPCGGGSSSPIDSPPAALKTLAGAREAFIRASVAENPAASVDVLRRVLRFHHREFAILAIALRRPEIPLETLRKLARHSRWTVRQVVARHAAADPELLLDLAGDPDSRVRIAVLRRRTLPPEVENRVRETFLRLAVQSTDPRRAEIGLRYVTGDERALEHGARSTRWRYRLAVALNPATPPTVLALLTADGNRIVLAAARRT